MNNLTLVSLQFGSIAPSLVLIVGALVLLLINVFARAFDSAQRLLNVALCSIALLLSMIASAYLQPGEAFFTLVHISGFTILAQLTMGLCALVFIALSFGGGACGVDSGCAIAWASDDRGFRVGEFYPLYLFMVAGFDLMVSSQNLLVILLGLEIGSLSLVALIALNQNLASIEAGVKYFVLSVLASVLYIAGVLCWYIASASFDLGALYNAMSMGSYLSGFAIVLGIIFMVAAIGFKISAVPFHSWTPDVYQGSSAIMAGVISIIPKIAAFTLAISVFSLFVQSNLQWLVSYVLYPIIVLSVTLPNIAALVQKDIKRMLAFSSISHSGFVLACILINTQMSLSALYLYWILFVVSNLGAFGLLAKTNFVNTPESSAITCDKLAGVARIAPAYGVLGGIFFISLAGIPPFGLFFGKVGVVMSAFSLDYVWLGGILLINSAIAVFYYLRPVVAMYFQTPANFARLSQEVHNASEQCSQSSPKSFGGFYFSANTFAKILLWGLAIACCISIFMVQFLLDFIGQYVVGAY